MIRVNAYTNPETITIDTLSDFTAKSCYGGWKVMLNFRDKDEMKSLQDALNRLYPENMRTIEEMPAEDGYYLTQTGVLLYHDEDGDWSFRRPTVEDGQLGTVSLERVWDDGLSSSYGSWGHLVATLGADAFPLVPVKFA